MTSFLSSFRWRLTILAAVLFGSMMFVLAIGLHVLIANYESRELDARLRLAASQLVGVGYLLRSHGELPASFPLPAGAIVLGWDDANTLIDPSQAAPPALQTALATLELPPWVPTEPDVDSEPPDFPPPPGPPGLPDPFGPPPDGRHRGPPPRRGGPGDFGPPPHPRGNPGVLAPMTVAAGNTDWRVTGLQFPDWRVFIAVDTTSRREEGTNLTFAVLWLSPVAILLVGLGGWFLAGRAVRPTRKLVETARAVTAHDLTRRISAEGEDEEFAELIRVFNSMLERLDLSFSQAVRFGDNAAHEFKTPLAILQGQIEQALHEAAPGSRPQQQLSSMMEEVQRLKTITASLLLLARSDTGTLSLRLQPLDYTALLGGLVEDVQLLGPTLGFTVDVAPGIRVQGDASLLTQAILNVLMNAVKYNRPGGEVRIQLTAVDGMARLAVENTGDAIAEDAVPHVFERFFRGDTSHHRAVDGTGLGLNIAREIARAHSGSLTLARNAPDAVCFHFDLPLAP